MIEPENRPYQLDTETALAVERRLKAFLELGLLEAETIPVFEAATQTAADFLEVPICILGFVDQNRHWFKSAVGLSRLGLMNKLAQERQLSREESFCTHVVETHQVLAISDALNNAAFAKSVLVQHYGIRAYLGVPLMDATGYCLGAIEVMALEPRTFTNGDIKFLEITARWSMSEFERNRLVKDREQWSRVVGTGFTEQPGSKPKSELNPPSCEQGSKGENEQSLSSAPLPPDPLSTIQIKLKLLAQLTQELRTPLTSVLGMASVVGREIYGPLTSKQKEYLEIIQNSGRYLLSMVNEISELGALDSSTQTLNLTSVDIEMLCQQVVNTLEEAANRREQLIRLSVEPGRSRIWVLDKDKIRQLLYHLVFSVVRAATTGSVIHIRVAHKDYGLNLTVSVSHPWLGDGLTQVDPYFCQLPVPVISKEQGEIGTSFRRDAYPTPTSPNSLEPQNEMLVAAAAAAAERLELNLSNSDTLAAVPEPELAQPDSLNCSRESLHLLLSSHLALLHGGQISIQGTPESGYRYVLSLPDLAPVDESL